MRGKTAFGGGVDGEDDFAAVLGKREVTALFCRMITLARAVHRAVDMHRYMQEREGAAEEGEHTVVGSEIEEIGSRSHSSGLCYLMRSR